MLLLLASLCTAHDLGYTDAWARISPDGTWTVDVLVDVEALPPAFPLGRRSPLSSTRVIRQHELSVLEPTLLAFWQSNLQLSFGVEHPPPTPTLANWSASAPLPGDDVVVVRYA